MPFATRKEMVMSMRTAAPVDPDDFELCDECALDWRLEERAGISSRSLEQFKEDAIEWCEECRDIAGLDRDL